MAALAKRGAKRLLKNHDGVAATAVEESAYASYASAKAAWVDRMTTAKADAMRKQLFGALQPLGFAGEKMGGGDWRYTRVRDGRSMRVDVDFGSIHAQLRYEVCVEDVATGLRLEHLCYENVLGFGLGWWNFVSEENLADGVAVLRQFVEDAAVLPDALAAQLRS